MLVLRLLVMVLTIICLMDGHAEVSSSTTGIRDRRESPAVKTNELEVEVLDRKKKKKPKPSKKKKPKPGKKKSKPNKAKPKPTKPVTTTTTMSTSTLKTTTILTTPTITTTATTTTTTVSPTTTETTVKTTTSTASATTTLSTTTSATTTATTTTVATSSTTSTTTTTIKTTDTTSSPPTTAATTADSGAGGECKATNGKPCIFPFKDGNEEYNECKNEGGKYFWCATSVYDSGKYKHWSYCSTDGPCPLEGDDEECKATNNKPCVFPFKDGNKEYNECADHGGKYFWCATGTNSAGKYTAWSECPKDGSCPLPQKGTTTTTTTTTMTTTTTTTTASTTPPTIGTTMAPMEKKVFNSLKDLVKEESKNDTFKMLQTMNEEMKAINEDLEGQRNIESNHGSWGNETILKTHSVGDEQDGDLIELRSYGENSEFTWSTYTYKGPTYLMGESNCCSACKKKWPDTLFFEYWAYFKKCWCYKKGSHGEPRIKYHNSISTGKCGVKPCEVSKSRIYLNQKCPRDGFVYEPKSIRGIQLYTIKTHENYHFLLCASTCKADEYCDGFSYEYCVSNNVYLCNLLSKDSTSSDSDSDTQTTFAKFNLKGADDYCERDFLVIDSTTQSLYRYPNLMGVYEDINVDHNKQKMYKQVRGNGYLFMEEAWTIGFISSSGIDKKIMLDGNMWTCKEEHVDTWIDDYTMAITHISHPRHYQPTEIKCTQEFLYATAGIRPHIYVDTQTQRIINGNIVESNKKWPWMALIVKTWKGNNYNCGGVLIDCMTVLTAHHCLLTPLQTPKGKGPNPRVKITNLSLFKVYLGVVDTSNKENQGKMFEVQNIYYKRNYVDEDNDLLDDIAILRLAERININTEREMFIRPILLPPKPLKEDANNELWVDSFQHFYWIAGYGISGKIGTTDILDGKLRDTNRIVIKPLLKTEGCSWMELEKNLCVKPIPTTNPAKHQFTAGGDSGSPGMMSQITSRGEQWHLYGIHARANGQNYDNSAALARCMNVYYYTSQIKWAEFIWMQ